MWWLLDLILVDSACRIASAQERQAAAAERQVALAEAMAWQAMPRVMEPAPWLDVRPVLDLTEEMRVDNDVIDAEFRDVTPARWHRARPLVADARERLFPLP